MAEVAEQNRQLQQLVNCLTSENLELKATAAELRSRVNKAETEILKVFKKVKKIEKRLEKKFDCEADKHFNEEKGEV